MKKLWLPLILAVALLTACDSNVPNISDAADLTDAKSEAMDLQIDLLGQMDATNIEYIEPAGNAVYIIGVKRDKSQPQRELIYAVCDLDTQRVDVIARDYASIDGAHNMSVYEAAPGKSLLFTGQKILTLQDNKLISSEELEEQYKREAFLDLQHHQMVYVDESDLNLYLRRMDNDTLPIVIYKSSRVVDDDGNEHTLYPYNPRIHREGNKVLFGIAQDDTSSYQNVAVYDINTGAIYKTENLPIYADFLDFLWYPDHFITLEITDSLEGSPPGVGTIFTQYDAVGNFIKRTVLNCMALSCQRKIYPDNTLYAFGYSQNDKGGLALYDIEKNEVSSIYQSENYMVSPTVSPDGKKVLWVENGTLYVKEVASLIDSLSIEIIK